MAARETGEGVSVERVGGRVRPETDATRALVRLAMTVPDPFMADLALVANGLVVLQEEVARLRRQDEND